MLRRLNAIEIAEGALLADIAVIFQLLVTYLPGVGDFFRFLIPIAFTVLVLRRGFYVGIVGLCVAMFIIGVLTGIHFVLLMLLESGAGLFLGLVMKYRLRHFAILILGVTSGALCVYGFVILTTLLLGLPFSDLIFSLHQAYNSIIALIDIITARIGLANLWKHNLYPIVAALANIGFTYWWAFFYVGLWVFLWPVVIVIYYITNRFVRLLGYDVRAFPGGIIDRLLRKILRVLLRQGIKRGLIRRHA